MTERRRRDGRLERSLAPLRSIPQSVGCVPRPINPPLDDRRPVDRTTSYHVPATTTNVFRGTIWPKATTRATGRFRPPGSFFFRSANHRSKGKRPAHRKSSATAVCDSRQMRAEATILGTGPFGQKGVQRYTRLFMNDGGDAAGTKNLGFRNPRHRRLPFTAFLFGF